MRSPPKTIISSTRLARLAPRLVHWAMLWLVKYALFLLTDTRDARRHMRKMRWRVERVVLLHALQTPSQRSARTLPPPSAPRGFLKRRCTQRAKIARAAIGARLRRTLRGADAFENLHALFRALWFIHRTAARIAQRLARGLTRLCPIIAAQPPAEALAFFAPPSPAAADSS